NSSKPAINLDLDEDHNSGAIINGAGPDSEENFILNAGSSAIKNSLSTAALSPLYLSLKNTKPKQHHIRSPPTLL
ncbi:MAG: hypothetical protein K9K86_02955, partial [Pseudomonadales bacterium]|nr:hypothetical protein [Pseudomonadales bacterium]